MAECCSSWIYSSVITRSHWLKINGSDYLKWQNYQYYILHHWLKTLNSNFSLIGSQYTRLFLYEDILKMWQFVTLLLIIVKFFNCVFEKEQDSQMYLTGKINSTLCDNSENVYCGFSIDFNWQIY